MILAIWGHLSILKDLDTIWTLLQSSAAQGSAKWRLVHIALGEFEEHVRVGGDELIYIQLDAVFGPRHQDGA